MKISINDKTKFNDSLKGLHTKNFLIISSNYSVEVLYKLLKNNQRVINNKDENNETLLSYAIKRKNISIIDLLLTSPLLDYSYQNIQGNSYLHLAVMYELESIIKILVKKGIDINMKNIDGNTALHYAYSANNYKIIILLIKNKIDFTIKNNQGLIAEEIKPNSLKKDELIINKNNQINKSIIIDWDNNIINPEINDDKCIKELKSKISTPIVLKKNNIINDANGKIYSKKKNETYKRIQSKEFRNFFEINKKDFKYKDYNNTEKVNKKKYYFNCLLDSKQETIRKNIFESKILPSKHQIKCHICDLNYLNTYHKNNLKNNNYKKICKSQYFIKRINNFSPLKLNNRYELNDDNDDDYISNSERSHLKSARLIHKEKTNFLQEIKIINEKDHRELSDNNNEDNFENSINDSINQQPTNDTQNNLFLHHFLSKIKMEKYYYKLQNNGFDDLNLLITQTKTENPITDLQLKEIGINNLGDRTRILIRLEEVANNFGCSLPNEVYYICENPNKVDANEDAHINKLLKWLNKLNIGEYLDNFVLNGYYSIELLLIQMVSKNPLNDDLLSNEIEINKIGHRSRILNTLIEESKEFHKKIKNKGVFIISGRESKICDCLIF